MITKNYRLRHRKLYSIDRQLIGRSRKQHPVVLATSRKLQIILLIPAVKDFVTKFYSVALHRHQATKFCTPKPYR